MPVPIICLDEHLRQCADRFRQEFSKPQYQYLVTVRLRLMLCEGRRTLRGPLRQIAAGPSEASLSRFLSQAPGLATDVVECWLSHFREGMQPQIAAERQRQRQAQPKRRGRPKPPVVTGYLIGDDSTIEKRKGKKMEGVGLHHSTTQDKRVRGHSLVESLYVLLGRRCPLAPQLYRQQAVCAAEGVLFQSKIDLMETVIRTCEPVAGTVTHVLLDTCYSAKGIWRAARQRGFLITSGRKCNRWLRVEDPTAPNGWGGPRLSDYTAHLSASDYVQFKWPKGEEDVYMHVVTTQVLLALIAARWDIEVLFGDGKEELGLDQYQLMSATAVVRFWTLAMLAYIFLEEERDRLQTQWQRPVTIGEARREIQRRHRRHLLNWLHEQFQSGVEPDSLYELLSA